MKLGELLLACMDTCTGTQVLLYEDLEGWENDEWFCRGSVSHACSGWSGCPVRCFSCEYFPDGGVKVFHVCLEVCA